RAERRSSRSIASVWSTTRWPAPRKWSCIVCCAVRYDRAMRRMAFLLVAIPLVLRWPVIADAQIYRWVDDNGVPHFTDGIDSVPDRYRSKAVPLGRKNAPPAPAPPGAPGAKASGETAIQFILGQRIMVDARINGNAEARLMLDTGADRTLISPRALQAA